MVQETANFTPPISSSISGEALSMLMVSFLERRYLTNMKQRDWQWALPNQEEGHILIREVLEMGRVNEREELRIVMPHILRACHEPGHALVMVLQGVGKFQKVFLGTRRISGLAQMSTTAYVNGLESAFKTYYGGLKVGSATPLNEESSEELYTFIQSASVVGAITGIPSNRSGIQTSHLQSIDRLARAAGNGNYVMMTVAEPVEPAVVDSTLDTCRRLKSEIHSLIRLNVSEGQSHSVTRGRSEEVKDEWTGGFRLLGSIANFLLLKNPAAAPIAFVFQAVNALDSAMPRSTLQESDSVTTNSGTSRELFNAHAAACDQLLDLYIQRLQSARSSGWWKVVMYVMAEDESTFRNVTGALKSLCSGDNTALDPIRVLDLPSGLIRDAALRGQVLSMTLQGITQHHPLGQSYDAVATCINSDELATLIHLPINELPGLPFRRHANFALSVPPVPPDVASVRIGTIHQEIDMPLTELEVPLRTLNRHLFVTGMSGYGKTNTCMQVLFETYQRHGVPFLVIEPAKKEYRNLAQIEGMRSKIRVFGIGDRHALPLRINPFEIMPGVSIAKHIDLLKAVFNASFPMYAGMSYVLEDAILDIYLERGWNIFTSENRYLKIGSSIEDRQVLMPTLQDLFNKIDAVLEQKAYGKEIQQNLGAALRSRIQSLTLGSKGQVLNSSRSLPFDDLMNSPAVVELQDLGDDEEKAFIMALFLVYLYEYAELRRGKQGQLQHITLIEEAHRLLSSKGNSTSGEAGDPRAKAVAMFADMLAEMRAYGEGFIIADQVPTNLNPIIIKNTNLKIVHRLSAPDDRQLAGTSLNLNASQIDFINNLNEGFAIIHDDRMGDAVLVKLFPFKDKYFKQDLWGDDWQYYLTAPISNLSALYRHQGCTGCPNPCKMLTLVNDHRKWSIISGEMDIDFILIGLYQSKAYEEIKKRWQLWLDRQQKLVSGFETESNSFIFCNATQQAFDWIAERLEALAKGSEEIDKENNPTLNRFNVAFDPRRRVLQERLAKQIAQLFGAWLFNRSEEECRSAHADCLSEIQIVWQEASKILLR